MIIILWSKAKIAPQQYITKTSVWIYVYATKKPSEN